MTDEATDNIVPPSPSSSAGASPFWRHAWPLLVFSFLEQSRRWGKGGGVRGEVDVRPIIVVAVGAFFFFFVSGSLNPLVFAS